MYQFTDALLCCAHTRSRFGQRLENDIQDVTIIIQELDQSLDPLIAWCSISGLVVSPQMIKTFVVFKERADGLHGLAL
jgi:hypothetical protein